ncbi:class I SAM-dependent methyltransferase [Saccharopolyspora indica]|uniref:class I SAM-dependent methyltransferase n=1 Tax=Saccharopolyspora indica TaxID=1229659 RepID=UPI0022EB6B34|nr:class I SAM-dependent methyltransferase [Saccharopolyspora indica]MDA3648357.1 class I SAM-dependent methyltransferase [Saccharopolyspora indica]
MTSAWTNESAIGRWNASTTREAMDSTAEEGDFAKRHLVNPVLLRLLGEVSGRRIMDAGCGNGYFSRMLAERGAHVTGVEPASSMVTYARDKEADLRQGITYVEADLARLPDLGGPFDAVVCSMVLMAIPDWKPAMRACVESLRPGGLFVFAIVHPAFEQLWTTWRAHGEYRTGRYLQEYEIPGPVAPDFHRPISAYLNELTALGGHLREIAEPGLDPTVAARTTTPGLESYTHLPNFLITSAETPT